MHWFNRADVVSMSLKLTFADMDLRVDVFILGMIRMNIGRHTEDLCHDTVLSAPQRSTWTYGGPTPLPLLARLRNCRHVALGWLGWACVPTLPLQDFQYT